MRLLVLLLLFGIVQSCRAPIKYAYRCPLGRPVFDRIPTAANNYTTKWCIGAILNSEIMPVGGDYACSTKENYGPTAFMSAPVSQPEMDNILPRIVLYYSDKPFRKLTFEIAITGVRKPSCALPNTCKANETYIMSDPRTSDPTFMSNNWMVGQPDNTVYNGTTTKDCLSFNQDGKFRNIFCPGDTYDNDEYFIYGVFCAFPAEKYQL